MSADFNNPTVDDQYTEILPQIRDNQNVNAVMFNNVSASNIPINAVQFVSGQFNLWDGGAWNVSPVAVAGGGTGATNAANARANLGVSSTSESDLAYLKITSNLSDLNNKSTARDELDVYGKSEMPDATTSVKGFTQLNNTLTSTSIDQALTAAQGKTLKDQQDINNSQLSNLVVQNDTLSSASGDFTTVDVEIQRIGNQVIVTGSCVHLSNASPASLSGFIPLFARPSIAQVSTVYSNGGGVIKYLTISSSGLMRVQYDNATTTQTDTFPFTISYIVA